MNEIHEDKIKTAATEKVAYLEQMGFESKVGRKQPTHFEFAMFSKFY